ncbi:hypothetical protein ACFT43_22345, partial [Streptomyces albidoflavus]
MAGRLSAAPRRPRPPPRPRPPAAAALALVPARVSRACRAGLVPAVAPHTLLPDQAASALLRTAQGALA